MNIFVTGATGFTGKRILPLLKGKGEVRCLVRHTSDIQRITNFDCEIAYGDLGDLYSLKQAMSGCDMLINIASLGFGHAPGIVKTAEEAGIKRAVFVSTTSLFTKLNAKSKSIRQQAENCIKSSNLDWTVLRPTMIYGAPDDRNIIKLIRFINRFPFVPIPGNGNYLQQPVYVEDVAKAIVAVLFNNKTVRKEFNISGKSTHTYNEIVDLIAAALERKIAKIHVPFNVSMYAAKIYEKFFEKPFVKSEQIMRLNENKNFENSFAQEIFGFTPISFHEGIAKEVALYRNEA